MRKRHDQPACGLCHADAKWRTRHRVPVCTRCRLVVVECLVVSVPEDFTPIGRKSSKDLK